MRLERLDVSHLDAVMALAEAGQAHAWGRATLAQALNDDTLEAWGAWRDALLLGYAVLAWLPFEAELQAITVAPSARRQGMAGMLLTHLVTRAHQGGAERLLLEVRASNAPALALYRQYGFDEDGRRHGYYPPVGTRGGKREAAVLMSRPLAARGDG
ncbi:[SSU ribosomal protein S18P]-alanine acetyltransferase [Chromohalobacter marismortui]|uniref:[SSU ribosomal protein S18P]-alanine acetyltransferase n=1 Tax=Chromohalobacter marismortui TaxID=42055 RepID=A0A4R7NIY4_9GAMM|nr:MULTISPECIES: ribosomal protein S18-alanine N-acetyltransferase [Chromohalobacter]MCI0510867.1 ribosomal protein S18-alanine N-acetyltransferase [Chromohalobacter sp.]MCI0592667.1 ribosomal protein S18-alanine N-acetyltransferase [Chromohalobacter sp.]TDU20200.1 [SSU ribosomal protein S18P]-alanine acetyltransferase [Chromohalobacter marismortui]